MERLRDQLLVRCARNRNLWPLMVRTMRTILHAQVERIFEGLRDQLTDDVTGHIAAILFEHVRVALPQFVDLPMNRNTNLDYSSVCLQCVSCVTSTTICMCCVEPGERVPLIN